MSTISELKDGITRWNETRRYDRAIELLLSGDLVRVEHEVYNQWISYFMQKKLNPLDLDIHVYLTILNDDHHPQFVLVDSFTDNNRDYVIDTNVFVRPFVKAITPSTGVTAVPSIDFTEVGIDLLTRKFRWFLYAKNWFNAKRNSTDGPVRVFTIPFSDFMTIFLSSEGLITDALLFFGLKHFLREGGDADIEVLVASYCSQSGTIHETLTNVTTPCPPFSVPESQFGLFE